MFLTDCSWKSNNWFYSRGTWQKLWLITVAAAKSLQSCLTLCDPIDGSPPGSPVPGILQARTLRWVAISFSNAWKWKVKGKSLSRVWLFTTPWTAAYQAPPSMGFSRQEYWSGCHCLLQRQDYQGLKWLKHTLASTDGPVMNSKVLCGSHLSNPQNWESHPSLHRIKPCGWLSARLHPSYPLSHNFNSLFMNSQ